MKLSKITFAVLAGVGMLTNLHARQLAINTHDSDPMECLFKDSVAFMHHFLSQDAAHPRHTKYLRWIECKKAYCLEIAIPGASKDDIKISADDTLLKVEADVERMGYCKEKDGEMKNIKRHFSFTTLLPRDGKIDKIDAKMENGLLLLTLPKIDKPEAKLITVH